MSRQIAALEASLGVRLLERHTRQTQLTDAGRQFLEDAKTTLAAFDRACRNARLAERGELGELKIGFMMHAAFTIVPGLTRRFLATWPEVKIQLVESIPGTLPDEILRGRFDAGILFHPGEVKGLEFKAIHSEKLCLALPVGHPLTDAATITPDRVVEEGLIATPPEVAPTLREAVLSWFRARALTPKIRLETQLQQTIVSLVAEGIGVALVPESMAKLGVAHVVFRPIEAAPTIEHGIAWPLGHRNPSLPLFLATASGETESRSSL